MISEPIKVIDLETLKREKQRLKLQCAYQKELIKDKVAYIKSNYMQMIGEQLLPYKDEENAKINGILDTVNEFVFGKILRMDFNGKNKLSGALIKLAEVGIVRLFNNFKKKKE